MRVQHLLEPPLLPHALVQTYFRNRILGWSDFKKKKKNFPPGKHLHFVLGSIVQPVTQGAGVKASLFGRLKSVSVRYIQSSPRQQNAFMPTVTADLDS